MHVGTVAAINPPAANHPDEKRPAASDDPPVPTLPLLLDALLTRLAQLLPGKYTTPGDVWDAMLPDEQDALWDAVTQANQIKSRNLNPDAVPPGWPPGWLGEQKFNTIPPLVLPYLELASVLHLGRQTHVGCGTFKLQL